jgi:hypothetical protein
MKRSLAILLAGIAAAALPGCSAAEDRPPTTSEPPAPLPTTQPAPPSGSAKPEPGVTRPSPQPASDECGADKLAGYLNQLPTSAAMAQIRVAAGHDRIRTIRPGDAVTMDFRPDRLNVEIGENGRIKRFRCG